MTTFTTPAPATTGIERLILVAADAARGAVARRVRRRDDVVGRRSAAVLTDAVDRRQRAVARGAIGLFPG
ncbi:hypothetical protein QSU92_00250 [Microbacterium sp. ET2]|uniref:hypothetical protein n=1 Tax=Microbacterium albipurpureum TaxID=3050384 RepID=UPI00259CEB55|nr:hypothetical protein [Microbacterium sp. ET2 (Ac-2212)]WJL95711.1 hypothetical protein QSU92_00250 [Microbacterium sp. ET2 (Ac-2212)]